MDLIIPYDENISKLSGAFVKNNGEILLVDGEHESFARDYCYGSNLGFLWESNLDDLGSYFDSFREKYDKMKIDLFSSSKLSKEQLILYKKWLENYEIVSKSLFSDFLVYVLGFDKIENVIRKTITTVNSCPHIRFYNYYLMDYEVNYSNMVMKYNDEIDKFDYVEKDEWIILFNRDREYEDEINEIKKHVLIKDRYLFFK